MGIWHQIPFIDWLVVLTILKNMKVNWDYYFINTSIWKKTCSKPPTSISSSHQTCPRSRIPLVKFPGFTSNLDSIIQDYTGLYRMRPPR